MLGCPLRGCTHGRFGARAARYCISTPTIKRVVLAFIAIFIVRKPPRSRQQDLSLDAVWIGAIKQWRLPVSKVTASILRLLDETAPPLDSNSVRVAIASIVGDDVEPFGERRPRLAKSTAVARAFTAARAKVHPVLLCLFAELRDPFNQVFLAIRYVM